ncbi:hypothetical protein [Streptomyces sp. S.PNR 29]|uniref:hypothetical protein n=1 Tax=Streptomyces sp. S.PNR 29 TaxID=2973805 RepID=UPI0025AFBE06|nr:hypothetical protein [Streptomyces sp. S.PNR 29]MDN0193791.1 hypothetical protein [Streptomyces sp. S.PNR 29]
MRTTHLSKPLLATALACLALSACGPQNATPDQIPAGNAVPATTAPVPRPEDLPGWEGSATPRYGPGETPPGTPNAAGDIPLPLNAPAPSPG